MTEDTTERPPLSALAGVRYLGTSDVRTLTKDDLAAVGIKAKHDVEWSTVNDRLVSIDDLNAATVDYLAQHPTEFEIVTA